MDLLIGLRSGVGSTERQPPQPPVPVPSPPSFAASSPPGAALTAAAFFGAHRFFKAATMLALPAAESMRFKTVDNTPHRRRESVMGATREGDTLSLAMPMRQPVGGTR